MEFIDITKNWSIKIGKETCDNINLPYDFSLESSEKFAIFAKRLPDLTQCSKVVLCISGGRSVDIFIDNVKISTTVSLAPHFVDLKPFLLENSVIKLKAYNTYANDFGCISEAKIYYLGESDINIAPKGFFISSKKFDLKGTWLSVNLDMEYSGIEMKRFKVLIEIFNSKGKKVLKRTKIIRIKSTRNFKSLIKVGRATSWLAKKKPCLYYAQATILDDENNEYDKEECRFAVNSTKLDQYYLINARAVQFIGANIEHYGMFGRAPDVYFERRKLKILKDKGFNAVRFTECPHEITLDLCDELGIYVIVDIFNTWTQGNYLESELFKNHSDLILRNTIIQLRRHPSVVIYSMGADIKENCTGAGINILEYFLERVRALDDTREITTAIDNYDGNVFNGEIEDVSEENYQEFINKLDIAGYSNLQSLYNNDSITYPQRYFIGLNCDIYGYKIFSKNYIGKPRFLGEFFDNAIMTNSKECDKDYLIDFIGISTNTEIYREILSQDVTKMFIDVLDPTTNNVYDLWANLIEDNVYTIRVYCSAQIIALYMDGKQIGRKLSSQENGYITEFSVKYKPSKIHAIGYDAGKECARARLIYRNEPSSLAIKAEKRSVRHINSNYFILNVEVLNKDKDCLLDATNEIEIKANTDNIEIVGAYNGFGDVWKDNRIKAYKGRIQIVVLARDLGPASITCLSDGLKSGHYKKKITLLRENESPLILQNE